MFLTILFSVLFIALCVLCLGVTVFFKKNGTFPETEISKNPEMRRRGIRCAKEEEQCTHCQESCSLKKMKK